MRVSTADFIRNYSTLADRALAEPVTITKHGRDSLVLVSAEAYERLKSFDTRKHYYAWELPDETVQAMEKELARLEAEIEAEGASSNATGR